MQGLAYTYRAIRRDGAEEVGVIEAASRDDASASLSRRGLFPIEIQLATGAGTRRAKVPIQDLALGLRMLATLLESGLPIARALAAMQDLVPKSWQGGLPIVRKSVQEGQSLASALESSSLDIPPVVIGIIRAGEAGSGVAKASRRAAELMESAAEIRSAIRSALAYPLLLVAAGAASTMLLVGVVIPHFSAILTDLGQSLPASTRFVLSVSHIARAVAIPTILVVGGLLFAWRAWTASEGGRRAWHEALLSLPIVGRARRSAGSARTCASLAALFESGVPIAAALLHASRTTGDGAMTARMLAAREAIIAGQGIARALDDTGAMTPTAIRLIRTGEETGRLGEMLYHAARIERERTERLVRGAVRLLEPALILVLAGVVALVTAALLQAVYGVRAVP